MRIQPLPMFRTLIALFVVVVALLLSVPGQPSAEINIVPHQAGYTLDIKRTSRDSRVAGANGAMVYTWGKHAMAGRLSNDFC